MKTVLWTLFIIGSLVPCFSEETSEAAPKVKRDKEVNVVVIDDAGKDKRQTIQERSIGTTQHIQYGASPGQYLIRTKDDSKKIDNEYLSLLKQLEGGVEPDVGQRSPYLIQSQPQQSYQQAIYQQPQEVYQQREPKIVRIPQPSEKRQNPLQNSYQGHKYQVQRVPLTLRASQAVKATPVQGHNSNQGYFSNSNDHAQMVEARVQAALSVAEDRPSPNFDSRQLPYQYSPLQQAIDEQTFEKELSTLIAANQAIELRPNVQQIVSPNPQQNFFSKYPTTPTTQKPRYPTYIQQNRYVAPEIISRVKNTQRNPQTYPQQYHIETTKPQPVVQSKPVHIPRPVVSIPRPVYQTPQNPIPQYTLRNSTNALNYQNIQEINPFQIVPAPQLQARTPNQGNVGVSGNQEGFYQYYQAIPQQNEYYPQATKDIKVAAYSPRQGTKNVNQGSSVDDQQLYVPRYESQSISEQPAAKNINFKDIKSQSLQQTSDDDSLNAFAQQSFQQAEGLSKYSSRNVQITEPKSRLPQQPVKIPQSKKPVQYTEPQEEVQTVRLPPPKNSKVYTQEEFQALVAAGYSVTPVPVTDYEDTQNSFSPAPVNYPGHSDYQPKYEPEQNYYQKQATEEYETPAPAPAQPSRQRKQRRPTGRPQYRIQAEDVQSGSETQNEEKYLLPAEELKTLDYGMKTYVRAKGSARHNINYDAEA